MDTAIQDTKRASSTARDLEAYLERILEGYVDRILREPEVLRMIGADPEKNIGPHSVTLYRWERDGKFPKRFPLAHDALSGTALSGWLLSDVVAWMRCRARGEKWEPPKLEKAKAKRTRRRKAAG